MYHEIRDFLIRLGIRPNKRGFHYLIEAIQRVKYEYSMGNWKIRYCELYNEIGRKFHSTGMAVERAMRTALYNAEKTIRLSLSEFISEVADRLCFG